MFLSGLAFEKHTGAFLFHDLFQESEFRILSATVWPSGLRRWLKAPVRKGVGSNPTVVNFFAVFSSSRRMKSSQADLNRHRWIQSPEC